MNVRRETEKVGAADLADLVKADCLTGRMLGGIVLKKPGSGTGKRRRFVFDDRTSCYHLLSRVAGGDLLLGDIEKEAFRKLMRRMERHSGLEILTFAILGNHFHLLVRVPKREDFLKKFLKGDREEREARLFEHLKLLYSRAYLAQLSGELKLMKKQGMDELYDKTIKGYLDRLCSVKHFMKELKERFSRWFNKRHGRRGTLWQERYRSILVEDGEALRTMAAYIDLNPLRAGLVEDPKDYRWCGYAEAVAGSKRARVGLCRVTEAPLDSWTKVAGTRYLRLLLSTGMERFSDKAVKQEDGNTVRQRVQTKPGFDRKAALKKLKEGGPLTQAGLLRCKVKYFSDGMALGSKEFVEGVFEARRAWFAENRKNGAREIPLAGELGLYSLK